MLSFQNFREGDKITLTYDGRWRIGVVERIDRNKDFVVVRTSEGYRSFKYIKIQNLEHVELA